MSNVSSKVSNRSQGSVRIGQKSPNPGPHLERRGDSFRVVVGVPRPLQRLFGCATIRHPLGVMSLREAERLKHEHVARLKGWIEEARRTGELPEAFLASKTGGTASLDIIDLPPLRMASAIRDEAKRLQREGKDEAAEEFVDVLIDVALDRRGEEVTEQVVKALGNLDETPVLSVLEKWLTSSGKVPSTINERRKFVTRFVHWAAKDKGITPQLVTFDLVDARYAYRYLLDGMEGMHPATKKKHVGALRVFWKWAADLDYFRSAVPLEMRAIPWKAETSKLGKVPKPEKRPFKDHEISLILMEAEGHYRDLFRFLALTGMRLSEAVTLRVSSIDLQERTMKVEKGKTAAARRVVPIHPDLLEIVARRVEAVKTQRIAQGDVPRLFFEVGIPRDPAQGPGNVVTKYMGRLRDRLGIASGEAQDRRQAAVDTHSFRRWFTRKAADALKGGATGFSEWTIAQVVGHETEGDDLGMTMRRYAGDEDLVSLRACVEAVRLPA